MIFSLVDYVLNLKQILKKIIKIKLLSKSCSICSDTNEAYDIGSLVFTSIQEHFWIRIHLRVSVFSCRINSISSFSRDLQDSSL